MILQNQAALYALLGSALILLLHFLRARERRREISALFLWEGLPGDPQSRAAKLRQHIDPLLLLQLAILLALTLALTEPLIRLPQRSVSGLALVIDSSASMRTETAPGVTRYDEAVGALLAVLEETPSSNVTVIQLSEQPKLLLPTSSSESPATALSRSVPTWYRDGTSDDLQAMLGSVGGEVQFDRILIATDRPMTNLPPHAELLLFQDGENVGLTAFSVRQNRDASGVSAFVQLLNATEGFIDLTIRISDGENQATLSLAVPPESSDSYVIPFPNSRGSVFTATLDIEDAFEADNRRFFSLDRPIDVRLFWIGDRNRYFEAAMRASAPVTDVQDMTQADLIVVNQRRIPAIDQGVILLLQSAMEGAVSMGPLRPAEDLGVSVPGHPLLRAVDIDDLRIRTIAEAQFELPARTLIEADGWPVLAEYSDAVRRIFTFTADLMDTNLPIAVDFPILVRNLMNELVRIPPELSYTAPETGDLIPLGGRGMVRALTDSNDRPIEYSERLLAFTPDEPGIYTLHTDRGAYALTVNTPASETALATGETVVRAASTRTDRSFRLMPLWPWFLALAIVLLLIEAFLHLNLTLRSRRTP